jgi:HTH-type transcriptional regulator / antitoxin MqsA
MSTYLESGVATKGIANKAGRKVAAKVASKWNGQPCPICGEGILHDGVKTVAQKYKGRVFTSTTAGAFCDHCADGFAMPDPREESAWLAFRDSVDTAEATELARIRKKLKLTQWEAAQLAGGGKNAFSRYERGQTKPVAAVINLFRLLDRHPELLTELDGSVSV